MSNWWSIIYNVGNLLQCCYKLGKKNQRLSKYSSPHCIMVCFLYHITGTLTLLRLFPASLDQDGEKNICSLHSKLGVQYRQFCQQTFCIKYVDPERSEENSCNTWHSKDKNEGHFDIIFFNLNLDILDNHWHGCLGCACAVLHVHFEFAM